MAKENIVGSTRDYFTKAMQNEEELVRDYQSLADKVSDAEARDMCRQYAEDHAMKSHKIKDFLGMSNQQ